MTDAQTTALRESQGATIEAALRTERDPRKRAMWEAQRRKLAAWVAGERGRAPQCARHLLRPVQQRAA